MIPIDLAIHWPFLVLVSDDIGFDAPTNLINMKPLVIRKIVYNAAVGRRA